MKNYEMSESAIQKIIAQKLRKAGYLVTTRLAPPGWPDIRAFGHNRTIVIEVKKKGKPLSELQELYFKKFKDAGSEVYLMDDTTKIDRIINMTLEDVFNKKMNEK